MSISLNLSSSYLCCCLIVRRAVHLQCTLHVRGWPSGAYPHVWPFGLWAPARAPWGPTAGQPQGPGRALPAPRRHLRRPPLVRWAGFNWGITTPGYVYPGRSPQGTGAHGSPVASRRGVVLPPWYPPSTAFAGAGNTTAWALVLLRVRGQMERQWEQGPSHHPEGQAQRTFSGHARY